MSEKIEAFSLPLGPEKPGLSDTQMQRRKEGVYRVIRATMPSAATLLRSGVLQERLAGGEGFFWLSFDLVETPQITLPFGEATQPRYKEKSILGNLCAELARLKDEAEFNVIRVGTLAGVALRLVTMSDQERVGALDALSEQDRELWRLFFIRRRRSISITFPSGVIDISTPLFPLHVAEERFRKIRFKVKAVNRRRAELIIVEELTKATDNPSKLVPFPKRIELLRPLGADCDQGDGWFLLYAAEFRDVVVEAEVRMALLLSELSPSHLELIQIGNKDELIVMAQAIVSRQ
ncbi:hypothetical protein ETQ85_14400 [Zoogloea oleivorans]|uniref:Uncharacterized protein n=1 Tax=Zoogloea oleivorans TaxID=1552750 RepID=A0A6C2CNT1_9RHOO|nr:hypothetical protein [Zoogloea oleivorans]TYC55209.1 hypothetical protein ETQ85_14400 [Zoogloea oleivorans]